MAGREVLVSEGSLATLSTTLRLRAGTAPDREAYVFLRDGEEETEGLSWGELDRRARAIAGALLARCSPGDRALLLLPSGLDFVAAFFGCLYAGAVAVPADPPRPRRDRERLRALVCNASPRLALTTSGLLAGLQDLAAAPEWAGVSWLPIDSVDDSDWDGPDPDPGSLAFLQYTSGSTALPKGVRVTHANLVHNERMIAEAFGQDEGSVVVGWLPLYHDMGLIGNVLQPLWSGGRCVLMSPGAFLQRPRRWLEAITRYRATTSGGPSFAYDLCVRRIGAGEREGLDLSSWRVAFNGAEPVRAETLERFAAAFAGCGFRREAFYPCYGLAEATLFVTGGERGREARVATVKAAALERHEVRPADGGEGARHLVSCGRPWQGQRLAVVDPETGRELPAGQVGEIWVSGPSVGDGYWGHPAETARDFGAALSGGGPERFLRTGDLGFVSGGELFITGRLKDLIILRGRNLYPQDVELTAERSHPDLRPGGGAAFAVEVDGEERLVVVHEVKRRREGEPIEPIVEALRRAVAEEHEAQVYEVLLVRAGTVPRTSSGKVRRGACRAAYRAGELAVVGRSALNDTAPSGAAPPRPAGAALRSALIADERLLLVQGFLRRTLAGLLGIEPGRIDPDQPLTAFGLDSLAAVELQGRRRGRAGRRSGDRRAARGRHVVGDGATGGRGDLRRPVRARGASRGLCRQAALLGSEIALARPPPGPWERGLPPGRRCPPARRGRSPGAGAGASGTGRPA